MKCHPPVPLHAFAVSASFSRRTKRVAGASIPRRICFPRISTTMTVILSPMRIFSPCFTVKISTVVLLRRGGPSCWLTYYFWLGLPFLTGLLPVFLDLFRFLFSLVFLAFVSHSFILRLFDPVLLRGRIAERLLKPLPSFSLDQILYLWPFYSAAPSTPYTRAEILWDPNQISESTLSASNCGLFEYEP
jgi:hypothetical protein